MRARVGPLQRDQDPFGSNEFEANIVVTPAAASSSLSPVGSFPSNGASGGFLVPIEVSQQFLSGGDRSRASSATPTPRTPGRRRTSSVTLSENGDSPVVPTKMPTRQEKRAAAQAERQRLVELQRVRDENLARKEQQRLRKADSIVSHVSQRTGASRAG